MLTWLNTAIGVAAVEHGVLRAADAQSLMSVEALRLALEQERETLFDAAREQAAHELQAARAEAQQLLQAAADEAERMRQAAYEEGMRLAAQDWRERHTEATVSKSQALRDTHTKLAEIVTSAVERIVQSEDRALLYRRALKHVQSLTRGSSSLRLRVASEDHAHAVNCVEAIPEIEATGLQVDVVVDPKLKPGSCIFESDQGLLDAGLQTQLDGLRAAMGRAVRRASAEDEPGPAG